MAPEAKLRKSSKPSATAEACLPRPGMERLGMTPALAPSLRLSSVLTRLRGLFDRVFDARHPRASCRARGHCPGCRPSSCRARPVPGAWQRWPRRRRRPRTNRRGRSSLTLMVSVCAVLDDVDLAQALVAVAAGEPEVRHFDAAFASRGCAARCRGWPSRRSDTCAMMPFSKVSDGRGPVVGAFGIELGRARDLDRIGEGLAHGAAPAMKRAIETG